MVTNEGDSISMLEVAFPCKLVQIQLDIHAREKLARARRPEYHTYLIWMVFASR